MNGYYPFSGDTPTVEDYDFQRVGIENAIRERVTDFWTDGVVHGFELSRSGDGDLVFGAGVAYCGGERIACEFSVPESAPEPGEYIFIKQSLSSGGLKTHFITGQSFTTRKSVTSYSFRYGSSQSPREGELLIGRLTPGEELEDLRTYARLTADPRIHIPNTDTHTTAGVFRVGYVGESDPGVIVLTAENALTVHKELGLLFRRGILNLKDGHGDRLIQTRKIPSKPNTPTPRLEEVVLRVLSEDPGRDTALRSALNAYMAVKVSAETLSQHLVLLASYRSLVNQKRLLGYTLEQIQGAATVSGVLDGAVRNKKNELIVAGAAGVAREPGTVALSAGSTTVSGSGTAFGEELVGVRLLFSGEGGVLRQYTVEGVTSATALQLTTVADVTAAGMYFYQADAEDLGFGGELTSPADMVARVDVTVASKETAQASLTEEKMRHGNTVLTAYTEDDEDAADAFSLALTWEKPNLVDLEEIRRYRVRVYELTNTRTALPQGVTKASLESAYVDQIYRSVEAYTSERQKVEREDARSSTDSGSTKNLVKYTGSATFQPGTRVVVAGESRTIKAVDQATKTIELLSPLSVLPAPGAVIQSYRVAWDDEVWTERFVYSIKAGQKLVVFVQAITEYDIASDWSPGVVVQTDSLLDATGTSLKELVAMRATRKKTRLEVERDRMSLQFQDQILAVQRQVAEAPSREDMEAIVATVEGLQENAL